MDCDKVTQHLVWIIGEAEEAISRLESGDSTGVVEQLNEIRQDCDAVEKEVKDYGLRLV